MLRIIFLLLILFSAVVSAQPQVKSVSVLADNLRHPWSMAPLPNGSWLVSERNRGLSIISSQGVQPIKGVPSAIMSGQGGYLGVHLDDDFTVNQQIYLCYVAADETGATSSEVISARLVKQQLTDIKTLFVALPKMQSAYHFGCRLEVVGQELFISLGERYHGMQDAQTLTNHHGKLIRILTDGQIPSDNPFIDSSVPAVYSYGHRNIQGLYYDAQRQQLFAHEHGPKGGDEFNLIIPGANYGWPSITYGVNYDGSIITPQTAQTGMQQPLLYWVPSIAPSGLAKYGHDWLLGSMKFKHLRYLKMQNNKVVAQFELLTELNERIRDVVVVGKDIYVLTDSAQGKLIHLQLNE